MSLAAMLTYTVVVWVGKKKRREERGLRKEMERRGEGGGRGREKNEGGRKERRDVGSLL